MDIHNYDINMIYHEMQLFITLSPKQYQKKTKQHTSKSVAVGSLVPANFRPIAKHAPVRMFR